MICIGDIRTVFLFCMPGSENRRNVSIPIKSTFRAAIHPDNYLDFAIHTDEQIIVPQFGNGDNSNHDLNHPRFLWAATA